MRADKKIIMKSGNKALKAKFSLRNSYFLTGIIVGVCLSLLLNKLYALNGNPMNNFGQKTEQRTEAVARCDVDKSKFKFYSQGNNGIDQQLFFEHNVQYCNGVFVDIGAHDGKTFSNTKFFEEFLGWRGLCVEPIPDVFTRLAIERPGCINIHGGVSTSRDELEFLQVSGYPEMLSGFVQSFEQGHMERINNEIIAYGGNATMMKIPSYPLHDLLEKYQITSIDFLSVDVEGGEVEVLKSIDFRKVTIKYIVAEENTPETRVRIENYLQQVGYTRQGTIGDFNGLYVPLVS
jgi:FkbM family methyltransferase